MPEQPIPEHDPVVTKSYALYYVVAMVLLMATLFWALWDEAYGQRPWKAYQHEWKTRYLALLSKESPKSAADLTAVEKSADYAALQRVYDQVDQQTRAQVAQIKDQVADANAKLLAVRSVFTDRRAYVNALTYDIETSTSASAKKSYQRELDEYESQLATVEFPDHSVKKYSFKQLEEAFNEANAEKTRLSLELGDVLKPVTEANTKMLAYINDHMVDLTPEQIDGLKKKTEAWDPKIVQVNVPMPTSWTAASPATWARANC